MDLGGVAGESEYHQDTLHGILKELCCFFKEIPPSQYVHLLFLITELNPCKSGEWLINCVPFNLPASHASPKACISSSLLLSALHKGGTVSFWSKGWRFTFQEELEAKRQSCLSLCLLAQPSSPAPQPQTTPYH